MKLLTTKTKIFSFTGYHASLLSNFIASATHNLVRLVKVAQEQDSHRNLNVAGPINLVG